MHGWRQHIFEPILAGDGLNRLGQFLGHSDQVVFVVMTEVDGHLHCPGDHIGRCRIRCQAADRAAPAINPVGNIADRQHGKRCTHKSVPAGCHGGRTGMGLEPFELQVEPALGERRR